MTLRSLEYELIVESDDAIGNLRSIVEKAGNGRGPCPSLRSQTCEPYPFIIPLRSLNDWIPQDSLWGLLESFCSEDPEATAFLRTDAIHLEEESICRTYLCLKAEGTFRTCGFFTLGTSHMRIFHPSLCGAHKGDGFLIPTYLVADACPGLGCPMTIGDMLESALRMIRCGLHGAGSRYVRADCRSDHRRFYEDAGFGFIRECEGLDQMMAVIRA